MKYKNKVKKARDFRLSLLPEDIQECLPQKNQYHLNGRFEGHFFKRYGIEIEAVMDHIARGMPIASVIDTNRESIVPEYSTQAKGFLLLEKPLHKQIHLQQRK